MPTRERGRPGPGVRVQACDEQAVELGVHRERMLRVQLGLKEKPGNLYGVYHGIRQRTDVAHACIGCGMCSREWWPRGGSIMW